MPWGLLKAPPETTLEVTGDNGVKYTVTFRGGRSFLPLHLFNCMVREGLIVRDYDTPEPRPRFEQLAGGVHGKQISPFADFVREVTS